MYQKEVDVSIAARGPALFQRFPGCTFVARRPTSDVRGKLSSAAASSYPVSLLDRTTTGVAWWYGALSIERPRNSCYCHPNKTRAAIKATSSIVARKHLSERGHTPVIRNCWERTNAHKRIRESLIASASGSLRGSLIASESGSRWGAHMPIR